MRCHSGEVDLPGVEFNEEQHVEPPEKHSVNGEEVGGQDGSGLGTDEVPPREGVPAACWIESRLMQHPPDGGGRDGDAEPGQLALDAQVAPPRVLARQAQDEGPDLGVDGRTAWTPMGIGPAAGNQLPMPAQKCLWPHNKH